MNFDLVSIAIIVVALAVIIYYWNRTPEAPAVQVPIEKYSTKRCRRGCKCAKCTDALVMPTIYSDVEDFTRPGTTVSGTQALPHDYNDYIVGQAVDQQVVDNQRKFVQQRDNAAGSNLSSGPRSIDAHDSYDPIAWVGIRGRPQAIPTPSSNTTQVPDIDSDLYSTKTKLSW